MAGDGATKNGMTREFSHFTETSADKSLGLLAIKNKTDRNIQ